MENSQLFINGPKFQDPSMADTSPLLKGSMAKTIYVHYIFAMFFSGAKITSYVTLPGFFF